MQLALKGLVSKVSEESKYIDKYTKEKGPINYDIQLIVEEVLTNGKTVLEEYKVNLNKESYSKYKDKSGERVEVLCNLHSRSPILLTAI